MPSFFNFFVIFLVWPVIKQLFYRTPEPMDSLA